LDTAGPLIMVATLRECKTMSATRLESNATYRVHMLHR